MIMQHGVLQNMEAITLVGAPYRADETRWVAFSFLHEEGTFMVELYQPV